MKDKKKEAVRHLKYWMRQCQLLGVNGVNGVNVNVSKDERNEEERKENLPPTPPIREKGEEEKKGENEVVAEDACACACEGELDLETRRKYANKIPTLDEAISFAQSHIGNRCTPEIVREWFTERQMGNWCDGKGNPIHNWGLNLSVWVTYYDLRKRKADPDRIPDARKRENVIIPRRKACNWRGTKKENLQDVL